MEPEDRLAVVVVNYGSSRLLADNLVRVQEENSTVRVVVTDNFSTPAERTAIDTLGRDHGWTIVHAPNDGFGPGVNRGVAAARAAGATRFLLLNPDAYIGRESLESLEARVRIDPMAVVSPRILDSTGRVVFAGMDLYLADGSVRSRRLRTTADDPDRREWLTGACLLIDQVVWDLVGGFGEDWFMYWEDVDFSRRAADAGADLVVVQDATAVHDAGGTQVTIGGQAKSPLYYYYNNRNRLLFVARHGDRRTRVRWLLHTPAAAKEILLRGGRRQLLHSTKPLTATIAGVLAGIRCLRREARR